MCLKTGATRFAHIAAVFKQRRWHRRNKIMQEGMFTSCANIFKVTESSDAVLDLLHELQADEASQKKEPRNTCQSKRTSLHFLVPGSFQRTVAVAAAKVDFHVCCPKS